MFPNYSKFLFSSSRVFILGLILQKLIIKILISFYLFIHKYFLELSQNFILYLYVEYLVLNDTFMFVNGLNF